MGPENWVWIHDCLVLMCFLPIRSYFLKESFAPDRQLGLDAQSFNIIRLVAPVGSIDLEVPLDILSVCGPERVRKRQHTRFIPSK